MKKEQIKEFSQKNERKIRTIIEIVEIGAVLLLTIAYIKKVKDNKIQEKIINLQKEEIIGLKEKCKNQYSNMSKFMSKALKEGSSEAGRQMAYRKQALAQ